MANGRGRGGSRGGSGEEYDSRQKSEDGGSGHNATTAVAWRRPSVIGRVTDCAPRSCFCTHLSIRRRTTEGHCEGGRGREAECKPRSAAGHSCTLCNAASMSDDRVSNDDDPPPPRHRAALRRGGQSRGSE